MCVGAGYTYDAVQVMAHPKAVPQYLIVTASDVLTTSFQEEYVESFSCTVADAVTFFAEA